MKKIKLGQYRLAIMVIIVILTGIVVLTEVVTIYLALGLVGLGWVIFEISIVLRTVLALQRMIAYLGKLQQRRDYDDTAKEAPTNKKEG